MNMILRAKVKIMLRHLQPSAQWLIKQMLDDAEETEAKLHKRISELETEMWYYKEKYMDEFMKKLR